MSNENTNNVVPKDEEIEVVELTKEEKLEKVRNYTLQKKLQIIQGKIKVPKGHKSFGYNYRNVTDILDKLKPMMKTLDVFITLSDEILAIGEYAYLKATATIHDINTDDIIIATSVARDMIEKTKINDKGVKVHTMDSSQITGSSSTYARKYALGGLLLIDDTQDDPDKLAGKKK